MKVLENIVFLGKQGIALCGVSDDKTGIFYQLLLLQPKDDPALLKWIYKTYNRHITPQAQNGMLKLLVLKLLHKIAIDNLSSGWYSILAYEATNGSNTQQLVICIKCVMERSNSNTSLD